MNGQNRLTAGQQMVSSCTGAVLTSLLVTPLDVVKIRLQSQQKAFMSNKCFLYCNGLMDHLCPCPNGNESTWYRRPSHFSGTLDAFIKISRTEGLGSLWSGLPPTLLMAIPSTVIYFTAYEQISYELKRHFSISSYNMWVPLVSGAVARVGSAVAISPLELIRTKMQSKKLSYREIGVAMRLLVHHNGYLSLWRGLGPTILRDVPFSSIYWLQYEYIKHRFNRKQTSFQFSFMAGAAAGAVAAVVTLPFDVVKTHRQIELGEKEIYTVDHPKKSASTYQILKRLYLESGFRSLFTGIVPRVIKVAPACALMISTYEYGKSFFHKRNERQKQKTLHPVSFIH